MLLPSLSSDLNLHALQHPFFQPVISNIHARKASMGSIELEGLDSSPYLEDGIWRKGYRIWDGPLECVSCLTRRSRMRGMS